MQGEFLEETIRSVLLQGYPDIEYMVIDGGSRDNSRAIIEKYSRWLAHWRSEKDDGQPDAINKGLERATGQIIAYINSDDWYFPGAFHCIAARSQTGGNEDWWVGTVEVNDGEKRDPKKSGFTTMWRFMGRAETLYQPAVFWSARLLKAVPRFDAGLHYVFDHEYWVRALELGFRPVVIDAPIAHFRIHGRSKTFMKQRYFMQELWEVARRHRGGLSATEWDATRQSLRTYEADYLLTSIYGLLAAGQRAAAAAYLLRSAPLYRHVTPAKLIAGAYYRTFITGAPPRWFYQA